MARNSNHTELRAAILDEAREQLVAHGYRALSMRGIAREVGCTATSIYLYFQDKDDLLHALIHEGMERLHNQLLSSVDGIEGAEQRCQRLCRSYLQFALENRQLYEAMFLLHPEYMKRYPKELYRRARRNLELFTHEVADVYGHPGEQTAQDLRLAHVIWAQLHGAIALHLAQRLDVRLDVLDFIDAVVENAVGHLRCPKDEAS